MKCKMANKLILMMITMIKTKVKLIRVTRVITTILQILKK